MDLTGLTRSAFLDELGRFAKDPSTVHSVQLVWGDSPGTSTFLPVAEYDALTKEEKETIINAGSAAGFVDTEGKSNA
jgi:hypothetical protein